MSVIGAVSRFLIWAIPGFLIAFGAAASLTIGLPFFLLGAAVLFYLWLHGPRWPADLGLVAGVGAAALLLATLAASDGRSLTVWAGVGLVLVAGSAALYSWLRCRSASIPRT